MASTAQEQYIARQQAILTQKINDLIRRVAEIEARLRAAEQRQREQQSRVGL